MSVGNLPCELTKEVNIGLGELFLDHVIPAFFNSDMEGVSELARMITSNGRLTSGFSYLQDHLDGNDFFYMHIEIFFVRSGKTL